MMRRTSVFLVLLLLVGCGSSNGLWVTGKLLRNGEVVKAPEGYKIGLTFYSMGSNGPEGKAAPGGEPYVAEYNPTDGAFRVSGRDGGGIPPGTYRVAVSQKLTREAYDQKVAAKKRKDAPVNRDDDTLQNAFGPTTSPIIRDLKSSVDITIDMNKPTE